MSQLERYKTLYMTVVFAVCIGIAAVLIATSSPSALDELETREYLHCTPQGGNNLACEVTHRKDNQ